LQAFLVAMSNPKLLLLFGALFPQFIAPSVNYITFESGLIIVQHCVARYLVSEAQFDLLEEARADVFRCSDIGVALSLFAFPQPRQASTGERAR
jgi:threonine/homoserine/homoserine lactone efflux protein